MAWPVSPTLMSLMLSISFPRSEETSTWIGVWQVAFFSCTFQFALAVCKVPFYGPLQLALERITCFYKVSYPVSILITSV